MSKASTEASVDKREQVLAAAIRVFSEQGFRATSMWDLARAVNLSKPALYHYVPSKEALLVELYERVAQEGVESVNAMIARTDTDPLDGLRAILIERIVYTCENRRLLQIFFEEEAELPDNLTKQMRLQRRAYEDGLIELLERGVKAKKLQFDANPRVVVNTLLGAAHWTYKWYNPRGRSSARDLAEQMVDMLIAGLMPRS
jgi:AcrR family transcriptional regulator